MRTKLFVCSLLVLAFAALPAGAITRAEFPQGLDASNWPPQDPAVRAAWIAALGDGGEGPEGGSNCCESGPQTGCDDAACVDIVCPYDSWCCNIDWDGICANEANVLCTVCGGGGYCCNTGDPEGCGDVDCYDAVCDFDSFCCSGWDELCALEAYDLCNGCYPAPQEVPTASTVGLGVLSVGLLLAGTALLVARRRRAG